MNSLGKKLTMLAIIVAMAGTAVFAATYTIDSNQAVPLPEKAKYNIFVNNRPDDGETVFQDPPVFTWTYEPDPATMAWQVYYTPDSPMRKFRFQISSDSGFSTLLVDKVTVCNNYNFLAPLNVAQAWWRIGYLDPNDENIVQEWSAVRTFYIAGSHTDWDRSSLASASYLASKANHPRMIYNSSNLPAIRSWIAGDTRATARLNQIKSWADTALAASWWTSPGPSHNNSEFQLIRRVALAWLLTNDTKYLDSGQTVQTLVDLAQVYLNDVHDRKDDTDGHSIRSLAFAFDWLYNQMTPSQRNVVINALDRHADWIVNYRIFRTPDGGSSLLTTLINNPGMAIVPTEVSARSSWQVGGSHQQDNFNMAMYAALAAYEHGDNLRELLDLGMNSVIGQPYFMGSEEGYNAGGTYSAGNFLKYLDMSIVADTVFPEMNLAQNPHFDIADWLGWFSPVDLEQSYFGDTVWRWTGFSAGWTWGEAAGLFTGNGIAYNHWLNENGGSITNRNQNDYLYSDIVLPWLYSVPTTASETSHGAVFPSEGWAMGNSIAPSSANAIDGAGFVFKCTPRLNREHADFCDLSFQLWSYGEHITRTGHNKDNNTAYGTNSIAHNTLLIDGLGQNQILEESHWRTGGGQEYFGEIIAYDEGNDYVYVCGDATNSYPQQTFNFLRKHSYPIFLTQDAGHLQKMRRHFLFVRDKYFVIFDECEATVASKFTWLYHVVDPTWTWSDTSKPKFMYEVGNVDVYLEQIGDPTALQIDTWLESDASHSNPITGEVFADGFATDPATIIPNAPRKLWISNKNLATTHTFLTVIYPVDNGGAAPTITRINDLTVQVSDGTNTDIITFDPAQASGATIYVDIADLGGGIGNIAPNVDAGADQTITLPTDTVSLDGTVTDDGLPDPPASVTTAWSKMSGPGTVTFGSSTSIDTTADFSVAGTYLLRLTADDNDKTSFDDVAITVNPTGTSNAAPSAGAGSDQTITWPTDAVALDGTVTDDGEPNPPGAVTTTWSTVSGPGSVTFANSAAVDTTATFSTWGVYVLQIEADDSALADVDTVQITVNAQAPPTGTGGFIESGGTVVMEAENYDDNDTGNSDGWWTLETTYGTYAGSGYVVAPSKASNETWADGGAELDYALDITNADTYRVYMRRYHLNPGGGNNSCHIGLDGSNVVAYDNSGLTQNAWVWATHNAQVYLSAGSHTFHIRRQESAYRIDRIVLTTDTSWSPSGTGPAESARGATNTAPVVSAGTDDECTLPDGILLDGTVSDDGLPATPGVVTVVWTKTSGPGTVTFNDSTVIDAVANFSTAGTYVLRLTADDNDLTAYDEVTITVNAAPVNSAPTVSAGSDDECTMPSGVALDGTVSDDGLPVVPGVVTTTWSKVSGPGTVTFTNSALVDTTAVFSADGTYVLQLEADDGGLSDTDTVQITVNPEPVSGDGAFIESGGTVVMEAENYHDNDTGFSDGWWVEESTYTTYVGTGYMVSPVYSGGNQTWADGGAELDYAIDITNADTYRVYMRRYHANPGGNNSCIIGLDGSEIVAFDNSGLTQNAWVWTTHNAQVYLSATSHTFHIRRLEPGYRIDRIVITTDTSWSPSGTGPAESTQSGTNLAPVVNAGSDDSGTSPSSVITLDGTVTDDGEPNPPAAVTTTWSKFSGPGTVTFGSSSSVDTTATFNDSGVYILRLTADDSDKSSYDEVVITIDHTAPSVNAGSDDSGTSPSSVISLDGTVSDDGYPSTGSLTQTWSKVSGPGTVTFGNSSAVDTTATFNDVGTYELMLTADDGDKLDSDTVVIFIDNGAPTADAGTDDTITLPTDATLDGSGSDDGYPLSPGSLAYSWSKVSGPGTVTFTDAFVEDTTASFSLPGSYVLRLTVSDSDKAATDDVTITVNAANTVPTVSAGTDGVVTLPLDAALDGTVSDDGLPNPPGAVTTTWSKTSGPGTVTFGDSAAVDTTAGFSTDGTYVLRLTADDSALSAYDEVAITVEPSAGVMVTNFDDDFDDNNLTGWTILEGSFDTFQFLTESGYEVHATTAHSRMSAPLSSTNLADSVDVVFDIRHTGGAEGSQGRSWKSGRLFFVNDSGVGFGIYFALHQNRSGALELISTTDNGNTESYDGFFTDPAKPNGNGLKTIQLSYDRVNNTLQCIYEGTSMGTLNVSSAYRNFTKVVVYLQNSYDGNWGQLDVDNIVITGDATNAAPTADAGTDDSITLPSVATLDGTVTDDGNPDPPAAVTVTWSKVSGPGTVTFGDSAAVDTTASFSEIGTYVLQLLADDGDLVAIDTVQIVCGHTAPSVNAGSDDSISLPSVATLDATVSDDGYPASPGSVTTTWTKVSGPGTVTFGNSAAVDTTASFSEIGTYVLQLEADDGDKTNTDTVQIVCGHAAPSVNAGTDDSITLPSVATLDATVSDDGFPVSPGSVTTTWTKTSGPGTVTFGNSAAVDTTAGFSEIGTYVLRITGDDGDKTAYDEVQIVCGHVAPTVDAGTDDECTLPSGVTLDGTVSDDGYPVTPGSVTTTWSKTSGPGTVTFGSSSAVDTTADFAAAGTYVLRLTADDNDLTAYDELTISVNAAPAGTDNFQESGGTVVMEAENYDNNDTVNSDGWWTDESTYTGYAGTGYVVAPTNAEGVEAWADGSAELDYGIDITTAGTYRVYMRRYHANPGGGNNSAIIGLDGSEIVEFDNSPLTQNAWVWTTHNAQVYLSAASHTFHIRRKESAYRIDRIVLTTDTSWSPSGTGPAESQRGSNEAPTVDAGTDDECTLPNGITLDGTVTDDGNPNPPGSVTTTWSKTSGAGTVTFGNSAAVDTTATFSTDGTYVLRLTADDDDLSAYDEVTITVNPVPGFVESGGTVVMEAENYDDNDTGNSDGWWTQESTYGTYAGTGYVVAPTYSSNQSWADGGAELDYAINITNAGTYRVYMRRYHLNPGGGNNSCHIGLDGSNLMAYDNSGLAQNEWVWATHNAQIYLSAASHTFHIRRQESAYRIDRIVLTTDTSWSPSGTGPAESTKN